MQELQLIVTNIRMRKNFRMVEEGNVTDLSGMVVETDPFMHKWSLEFIQHSAEEHPTSGNSVSGNTLQDVRMV